MNNYTEYMKSLGNQLTLQQVAQERTADARRDLAMSLMTNNIDMNDKVQAAEVKLNTQKAFPKGTGKDADPDEKKAVQAIRQVVSTYRKGCEERIYPEDFNTYSEWRKEVYGENKAKAKIDQIKRWIENNQITTQEIQDLLDTYKD